MFFGCILTHRYAQPRVYTHNHAHIYTYKYTHTNTYAHIRAHNYIYTDICTYTNARTHTHIRTHKSDNEDDTLEYARVSERRSNIAVLDKHRQVEGQPNNHYLSSPSSSPSPSSRGDAFGADIRHKIKDDDEGQNINSVDEHDDGEGQEGSVQMRIHNYENGNKAGEFENSSAKDSDGALFSSTGRSKNRDTSLQGSGHGKPVLRKSKKQEQIDSSSGRQKGMMSLMCLPSSSFSNAVSHCVHRNERSALGVMSWSVICAINYSQLMLCLITRETPWCCQTRKTEGA